jgi:hypothetical protein
MFCAAVPVTAAVGARLNADQIQTPVENRKPISKIAGVIMILLVTASFIYHTLIWRG